jgi:hypothetical protein
VRSNRRAPRACSSEATCELTRDCDRWTLSAAALNPPLSTTATKVYWQDPVARLRWIRVFTVVLPLLWAVCYLTIRSPVIMVQIGGVMTGVFLVAAVIAVWYLRRVETDPRLYGGRLFNTLLVVSSVAIGLLGVYSLLQAFGVEIG